MELVTITCLDRDKAGTIIKKKAALSKKKGEKESRTVE